MLVFKQIIRKCLLIGVGMDRRVKYTKKIIKESFIDLLQEKDIDKITVSELCEKSDINRATFYRYYIDIYDLLLKIELEFADELKDKLINYNSSSFKDIVIEYLKYLKNNRDFVKVIFSNSKNLDFLYDFFEYFFENFKNKWFVNVNGLNEDNKKILFIFMFNGSLGVIKYWIQNDFANDIDDLSMAIVSTCHYGLEGYRSDDYERDYKIND